MRAYFPPPPFMRRSPTRASCARRSQARGLGTRRRAVRVRWSRRPLSRARLSRIHHVVPFAAGGETLVDNLELRCRAHNAYEAEEVFGPMAVRETHMPYRSGRPSSRRWPRAERVDRALV